MSFDPARMRSNFLHLYGEVAWFGVLFGSTLTFVTVYAARLGASTLQLGIITGGPAILNLLLSLPGARWLEGRSLTRATFLTSVGQRLGFAALIALPWLFGRPGDQIAAVIAIAIVIAAPGTLLAIAFFSMFAEVVPPQYRAEVVARRNALMSVAIMVTVLASGWLLDRVSSPANYQIVFGIGAVGAAMSSYHIWRIRPLSPASHPPAPVQAAPTRPGQMLRLDLLRTAFGPLFAAYLCFYIAQNLNVPINPLFWINDLHIKDWQIGLGNALFYAAMTLSSLALPRLTARVGLRRLLVGSAFCFCVYPFVLGLAQNATLFFAASILSGFVWGIANGCLLNYLMERVPAHDRPAHMAWHNVALNLGITLGALSGAVVAGWIGNRYGLLLTGCLRVLTAAALLFWG